MSQKLIPYGNSHCKSCSGTVFDIFIFSEYKNPDETNRYRRVSDIDVILNQRSFMNKMGVDNLRQFIEDMKSSSPSSTFDLSSYSDDDLLSFTKSRYINSFSDMEQYARQINNDMETLKRHIAQSTEYNRRYRSLFDFSTTSSTIEDYKDNTTSSTSTSDT